MSNERNAGRKPLLSDSEILSIIERQKAGESMTALAATYGVSRQALYKRIKALDERPIKIDYFMDGQHIAVMEADFKRHTLVVLNYVAELSKRPFGCRMNPSWQEFCEFVENEYLHDMGANVPGSFLITNGGRSFRLEETRHLSVQEMDACKLPVFEFQKKDILFARTDTDGYQLKALSYDRRYFVKSQALISGAFMRDWAVEIIASDIAAQLDIPCIKQQHCKLAYGKRIYDGVYSSNFELDGYAFLSFETLLEKQGLSTQESYFVKLPTIEKLKWCAAKLSDIGDLSYEKTQKYMIDLAVLDCLVGNVDRHTRNFGLFYHSETGLYSIPPVFDNGMGLFEHDDYRDKYKSFEEAMHNVYVSPYGEGPFEMLVLVDGEFSLRKLYAGVDRITYPDILHTDNVTEYERRMGELWQRLVS